MQIEIAWYEICGEEPRAMTDFLWCATASHRSSEVNLL